MPSEIVIQQPDPPALVSQLAPLAAEAARFEVVGIETNATALERARALRRGEKAIEEHFEPARKASDAAKKAVLSARDLLIAPLAAARGVYDRKAGEWEAEQRRLAEAESRRLAELARVAEEERRIEDAIAAEAEGDTAGSDAILAEPVLAPVVTVAPAVAKVEGVSGVRRWRADMTDAAGFIRWLAAHPEETAMLHRAAEACGPEVNARARSQRAALAIPGWLAVEEYGRSYR